MHVVGLKMLQIILNQHAVWTPITRNIVLHIHESGGSAKETWADLAVVCIALPPHSGLWVAVVRATCVKA